MLLFDIGVAETWGNPQSLKQSSLADARCGTRLVRATPSLRNVRNSLGEHRSTASLPAGPAACLVRATPSLAAVLALLLAAFVISLTLCAPAALADDAPDPFALGAETTLPNGSYSADVTLSGGSGRASVASPALLTVQDGHAAITVVWSSSNYDYMKVADAKFLPLTMDGDSTFQIPVLAFDEAFTVIGDTTAMSTAHEVEYQLTVPLGSVTAGAPAAPAASEQSASASAASASASASSASASASASSASAKAPSSDNGMFVIIPIVVVVALAAGIAFGVVHYRKGRDQ